jgi:putative effector of murein hydrolase
VTIALLVLTVAAYSIGLALKRRTQSSLANPTLIGMVLVAAVLLVSHLNYSAYAHHVRPLSLFLTPAVVALAVPLHAEREILKRHALPLLLGVASGAITALAIGYLASQALHLDHDWTLAILSRTATSPISIALAGELHGRAALSAALTIIAGVTGATLGPAWLDLIGVRHPVARGLAHGVSSHGIGTARMVEEHQVAGAASAIGMALGGTLLAISIPLIATHPPRTGQPTVRAAAALRGSTASRDTVSFDPALMAPANPHPTERTSNAPASTLR